MKNLVWVGDNFSTRVRQVQPVWFYYFCLNRDYSYFDLAELPDLLMEKNVLAKQVMKGIYEKLERALRFYSKFILSI